MQTDANQEQPPQNLPTTVFLEQVLTDVEKYSPLNLVPVTDFFRQVFVTRVSFLESRCMKTWLFSQLVKLGLSPFYLFIILIIIASLAARHMYKNSIYLLCNLVGVVYPTYRSIKVIYQQSSNDNELNAEQKQWLTYWTVYGWLQIADYWSTQLLKLLPGYNFLKLIFLYWAQNDQSRGATLLFERVLKPLLRKPQPKLNTNTQKRQTTKWQQNDQQQSTQRFVKVDHNSSGPSVVYRSDLSPEEIWRRNPEERENEVEPYHLNHAN
ncbi:17222_t:CDS:1 [Dentiscutata heterogama]|uniref:17222_t:CDS:1 n=1 Tax=Dentiscutata heterogama TaxID=1316150 RepID=A0ACA9KAJ0_9GLOM|nr:17222_t:CDS:1 [Dentiscutata heterogama]